MFLREKKTEEERKREGEREREAGRKNGTEEEGREGGKEGRKAKRKKEDERKERKEGTKECNFRRHRAGHSSHTLVRPSPHRLRHTIQCTFAPLLISGVLKPRSPNWI